MQVIYFLYLFTIYTQVMCKDKDGVVENKIIIDVELLKRIETDRKQRDNEMQPLTTNENGSVETPDRLISCIICNNVAMDECNDPKNNLIPATFCKRDENLCYSQHTPFGVIDRGCYNSNEDLTTYVCACNLCNYISIAETPFLFSSKSEWADNVLELSRMRNLRKSILKDMACLKCEVNATSKKEDMSDAANCLQGNIGSLPTEECKEDEICAVKAIRKDGYIWRGCVKFPQFNYWWALCDSDLCNYDTISSIYDYLR
ncbi:hypothetical protein ABMA27_002721 [Loxostege sticticalis]|uniref:Uncharacterized protein n=1 Tax=Loxostege sticticalis TaxID=481309 RepID=A0ABR3HUU2_LOXSC